MNVSIFSHARIVGGRIVAIHDRPLPAIAQVADRGASHWPAAGATGD
ncbi:MAG TPA: hypothetical protein VFU22_18120 [Roseiflexaceae bacterium]|nr:hypothetical protein [Roseiflexaceae bacterium]